MNSAHNDPSPRRIVPKFAHKRETGHCNSSGPTLYYLILLFASFFTATLARQGFFYALFLARLQVVGVTLYFFDDVFLLNLALETAEGILQRLALLQSDFGQTLHPPTGPYWTFLAYQTRAAVKSGFFLSLLQREFLADYPIFQSLSNLPSRISAPAVLRRRYSAARTRCSTEIGLDTDGC